MASLILRHNRWSARVRIPAALKSHYGGREHLQRNLGTSDRRAARVEADAWEARLRLEWSVHAGHTNAEPGTERHHYLAARAKAEQGLFRVEAGEEDPAALGVEFEIDRLADTYGEAALPPRVQAEVAGLSDGLATLRGQRTRHRREYDPPFAEIAKEYIAQWKRTRGLKPSNTEQQKQATFNLFAGFWSSRPIRDITEADATEFSDALRGLSPQWGRHPSAHLLSWRELQRRYGGSTPGLSDATMNRHTAALKALWEWARKRGHCKGDNPFDGLHTKLNAKNVEGYLAWEDAELRKLFNPPPARRDLHEVMAVALFSGLRLNEIASLTGNHVKEREGITYFEIEDAKTPAGNRQVPVHPALSWIIARALEAGDGRIWPKFNCEGPGKKPGADAGREFSRFKIQRGFDSRRKVFHSFRKNVTRIIERAAIHESEWAQVFGHERGFTFSVYNPDGITLARKAEIIGLIEYPGIDFALDPVDSA